MMGNKFPHCGPRLHVMKCLHACLTCWSNASSENVRARKIPFIGNLFAVNARNSRYSLRKVSESRPHKKLPFLSEKSRPTR